LLDRPETILWIISRVRPTSGAERMSGHSLAGAVWADNDRDGRVDGYVYNGTYYQGTPQGYAPTSAPPPMSGERG
jgi:hypothetical protein